MRTPWRSPDSLLRNEHGNSRAYTKLPAPKSPAIQPSIGATECGSQIRPRAQRVHAFQRLRMGFAYCSTSIFFHCLTPFRMTSSDFSRADLNNGHRNGSDKTLQLNFPNGDSTTISRLRSLGAA